MRQRLRKIDCMLTCAAANLQYLTTIRKVLAQHSEYRIAIAVAGWRVGFGHDLSYFALISQ
jgi:hypothetical protein